MTRLLVTGGVGFIGTHVVEEARSRGWSVRILDALRDDVYDTRPKLPADVETIVGDVTDPDAILSAVEGVDVVCHLAAKVGLGVDIGDTPDYVRSNDLGTAELLAGMAATGVNRLVLASSMVVYGEGTYLGPDGVTRPAARRAADLRAGRFDPRDPGSEEFLDSALTYEDAPLDPRSVYAVTKLSQENLARVWAAETGGRAASLRFHNVYGPGMPRDTPYAGVASIFRSALARGEAPRVFEDGGQRRDFVHVRDIARACCAAVEWSEQTGSGVERAFNIGSGTVTTILEMARVLSEQCRGPQPVVTGQFRAGDVRHITASSDRARTELDWEPREDFTAGMAEFASAPQRV